MKLFQIFFLGLLVMLPNASAAQMEKLQHQSSEPNSKLELNPYGMLEFWIEGTGYITIYGETVEQSFNHPEFGDGDFSTPIETLFAAELGFDQGLFIGGNAHFKTGENEYYLKLSTYAISYGYVLLKVAPCPEVVSLPVDDEYLMREGMSEIARHEFIPNVQGFHIDSIKYFNYDEIEFYYDGKYQLHKGKFWHLDFSKIADTTESYRYITAHDYKTKLLAMDGVILVDEDNKFVFKLGNSIGAFSSYNSTFSIKIIEEDDFKQSLVLTPDKIKAELDKTGKITLDGVYFDFDKATLKSESQKAILSAVALMESYTDLVITIHGHTDNKGSEDYNRQLSTERAAAVVGDIAAQGIDPSRLQSRGFGENDPIATNDTDEGRAQNRRVELHKVSGGEKKSIITIDFIKPMENSIVESKYSYENSSLSVLYYPPHSEKDETVEYEGHLESISYAIVKDGSTDAHISRKEIVKNYENLLNLYNAKIIGIYSHNISFKIADRGDGVIVYGRVECYDGTYTIRFLIQE